MICLGLDRTLHKHRFHACAWDAGPQMTTSAPTATTDELTLYDTWAGLGRQPQFTCSTHRGCPFGLPGWGVSFSTWLVIGPGLPGFYCPMAYFHFPLLTARAGRRDAVDQVLSNGFSGLQAIETPILARQASPLISGFQSQLPVRATTECARCRIRPSCT